jgi:flagellar biosynthetic protein FliR
LNVLGLTGPQFETFLLEWIRIASMLMIFPVFSGPQVPMQLRLAFGLVISFLLYHLLPVVHLSNGLYDLVAAGASQVVLGVIVGYVASLVFAGIQFAGELIDLQIGFAVANVLNPTTQQNVTIIGEFQLAIATLVFLITNSHYFLIQGIAGSFDLVPLPYIHLDPSVAGNVVLFFTQAFLVVFKIAAPTVFALLITNISLAFMSKVAPQMNVFVIGLPIQVSVGLIMMAISIPLIGAVAPELYANIASQMDSTMRGLRMP